MYLRTLHEVYFGENKNIKEMQKCITNFRKDLFNHRSGAKLNTHPEIRRFNRLAEEEFGFKSFQLLINPDRTINAYTCSISTNFKTLTLSNNTMSNLIVSKNGYRYKKEAEYCAFVCVYRGLMLDKRLSDREVLAIILHEIGHNFQAAISNYQSILSQTRVIIYLIQVIMNVITNPDLNSLRNLIEAPVYLTGLYNKINKIIDDILYNNFPNFYYLADRLRAILADLNYPINKLLKYLLIMIQLPIMPLVLLLKLQPMQLIMFYAIGDFRGEKMADNFPTLYGYGPDIASATTKIATDEVLSKVKIPIISPMIGLFESTYRLLLTLPDVHPVEITRIKDQSDYLKKEIQREDLDPKFKKEIMDQINEIDKQLDDLISTNYKGAISDYNYTNHLYQLMLYKLFGGDPMDLYYKWSDDNIHADVQDVYDTKMNESSMNFIRNLKRIRLK